MLHTNGIKKAISKSKCGGTPSISTSVIFILSHPFVLYQKGGTTEVVLHEHSTQGLLPRCPDTRGETHPLQAFFSPQ